MSGKIEEGPYLDGRFLDLVVEEASEVIHAIMKIRRFGTLGTRPITEITNYNNLCYEIGDLLEVIDRLGLEKGPVDCGRERKKVKLIRYGYGIK